MVSTAREPQTANMGLNERNIETNNEGFIAVNERMQVLTNHNDDGAVVSNVWCIGDANGKMVLSTHAATAQGISAIENICGREHVVDHETIPVICLTHPEIAMVGPTESECQARADDEGWTLGSSNCDFPADETALVKGTLEGLAKVLYDKEDGRVVAVHVIGIRAADVVCECANAMAAEGTITVENLSRILHRHRTIGGLLDRALEQAIWKDAFNAT